MGLLARGAIAQLGERLLCKQEVAGSIPAGSIGFFSLGTGMGRRAGPQEPELAKSLSQATRSIPRVGSVRQVQALEPVVDPCPFPLTRFRRAKRGRSASWRDISP